MSSYLNFKLFDEFNNKDKKVYDSLFCDFYEKMLFTADFYVDVKEGLKIFEESKCFYPGKSVASRRIINNLINVLQLTYDRFESEEMFNYKDVATNVLNVFCANDNVFMYFKKIVDTSLPMLDYLKFIQGEIKIFFNERIHTRFDYPEMIKSNIVDNMKTSFNCLKIQGIGVFYSDKSYRGLKMWIRQHIEHLYQENEVREFLDNLEQDTGGKTTFRCLQILFLKENCRLLNCPMEEIETTRMLWNIIPDPFLTEKDFFDSKMAKFSCFEWYKAVLEQFEVPSKQPRTLKHQSRVIVRNCLMNGCMHSSNLNELKIPKTLTYYLSLCNDSDID